MRQPYDPFAGLDPVTELIDGSLYLGGDRAFLHLPCKPDLHVACAEECPPPRVSGRHTMHLTLDDAEEPWMSVPGWWDAVSGAARIAADHLVKGKTVLITCHKGINRSGMVCGLTLCELGWSPREAIKLMRSLRDDRVLSNRVFEQIVKNAACARRARSRTSSV